MASTPPKILEYLKTIDAGMKDQRVVTETELRALVWFFEYGLNVFSQLGRSWRGCSFRQGETTCSFVVRSGIGDTQDVAFITGRNPMDCVLIFCKKWHNDTLAWYPDRYA